MDNAIDVKTHGLPPDMVVVDCQGCKRLLAQPSQIALHSDNYKTQRLAAVFSVQDGYCYCASCTRDNLRPLRCDGGSEDTRVRSTVFDERNRYDNYHGYCRDDC